MNYRIKRLMKRSIAFLLTIAMLWSESSIAALASTVTPDAEPTVSVTAEPTEEPTEEPAEEPSEVPSVDPSVSPTEGATEEPSTEPTEEPSDVPSEEPLATPEATPTPDLLEGTLGEDLVKEPATDPLLEEDETAILSESELRAKYAVKSQKQDDELNLEETNSPAGVVISLWDNEQDQLINLDDIYQLEWYIYKTDQGNLGEDAKPVLIDEETLPLDEYTLLEDSSIIARLYLTEDAYQKTEKEPNVDYFDFSGGTYSKTEAVESTKASITDADGETLVGSKINLSANSGSIVECYWYRYSSDELQNATPEEPVEGILISEESDYEKTFYTIKSDDIGEYIYAQYKLAGDKTLYRTPAVGPLSDSEVSAVIESVTAAEGGLTVEQVYLDDPIRNAGYYNEKDGKWHNYQKTFNIVLNRDLSVWNREDEQGYAELEMIVTFNTPVKQMDLTPQRSYYFDEQEGVSKSVDETLIECISMDDGKGLKWKIKFTINPEHISIFNQSTWPHWTWTNRVSGLMDMDSHRFTYSDGTEAEFNIYVHDIGTTAEEVYLAEVKNKDADYNYSQKYSEYTLKIIDTTGNEIVLLNGSNDYAIAQGGEPYEGSIQFSGEAVEEGYVGCKVTTKDEYGFRHICITGKKEYPYSDGKQLTIKTDNNEIALNVLVCQSDEDDLWLFENEDDIGDYSKSVNAKGYSNGVSYGGNKLTYYVMLDPSLTDASMSNDDGEKPSLNIMGDGFSLVTESELKTKDDIQYYELIVSVKNNVQYNCMMFKSLSFMVYVNANGSSGLLRQTKGVDMTFISSSYTSNPFISGRGISAFLYTDKNMLLTYDGKEMDFELIMPAGETVSKIELRDEYKGFAELTEPITLENGKISFGVIPKIENAIIGFDIISSSGKKYTATLSTKGASYYGGYYEINGKRYSFYVEADGNPVDTTAYINHTYGSIERKTSLLSHMYKYGDNGLEAENDWFYPYLEQVTAEITGQHASDDSSEDVVWFKDGEGNRVFKSILDAEDDYSNTLYSGSVNGTAIIQYTYKFRNDSSVPTDLRGKTFKSRIIQVQVIDPRDAGSVIPPTFIMGDDLSEEDKEANATLLQGYINILEEISAKNGNTAIEVSIPESVKFKGNIVINSNVKLSAYGSELAGKITIESADSDSVAEITGLNIISENGVAVDASKAPVILNNCNFDCTCSSLLKVSVDTYAQTQWNGCSVTFTSGGCLLEIDTGINKISDVFALEKTDLFVDIPDCAGVQMIEFTDGALDDAAKWNVDGLKVKDRATVSALLLYPETHVINNAFEVNEEEGLVANSSVLILTDAEKKWLNPLVAGNGESSFEAIGIKPGKYEISAIPSDIRRTFSPYVAINEYSGTTGAYAKMLPSGYSKYVVFDINQKNGFPYGALVGKEISGFGDNGYILQYHADKSTEVVAYIENGLVSLANECILNECAKDLDAEGDVYDIKINTKVKGENVEEPIVLAFYSKPLDNQFTFDVLQEDGTKPGEYLLTEQSRELSLIMNGGIMPNYFNSDINFVADGSKCSMPDGQDITIIQDQNNENLATVSIPEGTSGILTVTAFYQSKNEPTVSGNGTGSNVKTKTYNIKLIGARGIEAEPISYSRIGSQYYGEISFEVNNNVKNAITGISGCSNGNYNFKVASFTSAATKWNKTTTTYTVQYMLDLSDVKIWDAVVDNPPQIVLETLGGEYKISMDVAGDVMTWFNPDDGLTYLFEVSEEDEMAAVFTGAVITKADKYYNYPGGRTISIPETVEFAEKSYDVKYMAYGCLNEIWENGVQMHSPEIVNIPSSVIKICEQPHSWNSCGQLIKDKETSDLRKICVAEGNKVYKSFSDGVALGAKPDYETKCYFLTEIATGYRGRLNWPAELLDYEEYDEVFCEEYYDANYGYHDIFWNSELTCPDFSNITEIQCADNNNSNISIDGMLLQNYGAWLRMVPGGNSVDALIVPEGVTHIDNLALKYVDINTLILPSTFEYVNYSFFTTAKNIYVYNTDTTLNPFSSGLSSSMKNITFYGYVDETGNSALKEWVSRNTKKGYKFVPLNTVSSTVKPEDYVVSTNRSAKKVTEGEYKGKEYYEICVGETLSETFDFTATLKNGYAGKNVDLIAEWVNDDDFALRQDEFGEISGGWEARKCGIAKVNLKIGDTLLKTVYLVIRPSKIEIVDDVKEIPYEAEGSVTFIAYDVNNSPVPISDEACWEWGRFKLYSMIMPEQAKVKNGQNIYTAWRISWKDASNILNWTVSPLLYQMENGEVRGCKESEVGYVFFGERYTTTVIPKSVIEYDLAIKELDNVVFLDKDSEADIPLYNGDAEDALKIPKDMILSNCLDISDGVDYPDRSYAYEQVKCTILEGKDLLADAKIVKGVDDNYAYLHLTRNRGKTGKAKIRVELPYQLDNNTLDIEVVVGKEALIKKINTDLSFIRKDNATSDSTDISVENTSVISGVEKKFSFDYEEGKSVLVTGLIDENGNSTILDQDGNPITQSKLTFAISDTNFAKWEVNKKGEKTGILLNGEGSTLVTITSKDANAASIQIVLEVKNYQPRLRNNEDTVNKYAVNDVAEYEFALPTDVTISGVEIESAIKDRKEYKESFVATKDVNEVRIAVNAENEELFTALKGGTYAVNLRLIAAIPNDSEIGSETREYVYPVKLKLTDAVPKVTVTADTGIELNTLVTRETALTVTVGDVVNGEDVKLALDTTDKVTSDFDNYFDLEQNGDTKRWSFKLKNVNGKTPAEIVKLFNGKDIKVTVGTSDYRKYPESAKVRVKLSYGAPKVTFANRATVTVNTADFSSYVAGKYTAKFTYELTDGFTSDDDLEGLISWKDAKQWANYQDDFIFSKAGKEITVKVSANVPKGSYKFRYTPEVSVGDNDEIFGKQKLAVQELTVNVVATTAKASLSSTKATIDKNYIYTTSSINLQFDENQIKNLYGLAYYVEEIDNSKMQSSIKLTKAPRNVDLNGETGIKLQVDEGGNITVGVDPAHAEGTVAGDYTYSVTPYVTIGSEGEQQFTMALAPLTFTVKVTDVLPTVQLEKTSVTVDNLDTSSYVLLNWNVTKGNYEEFTAEEANDWVVAKTPENGPQVTCEGGKVRIMALESTLKGTYEFTITPKIVLDSTVIESQVIKNSKSLKPVVLKVTVNGKRPTVKLSKTKLTVNRFYPGIITGDNYDVQESAWLEATVSGFDVDSITLKPADKKTETLQATSDAISMNIHENAVYAVPKTTTPKGTYSFYAYAKAADTAFEPVKFTVEVSDKKPEIKLSTTSVLLKSNYPGEMKLDMVDKAGCIASVDTKKDYLIMKSGKWTVVSAGKAAASQAYAIIETDEKGNVTVSSGKKASSLTKSTSVTVNAYEQNVYLKGNEDAYTLTSKLTIKFDTVLPTAVLSEKKLTLNINNMEPMVENALYVSTSSGTPIDSLKITEGRCPESGALSVWSDVKADGSAAVQVAVNKDISTLKTGSYPYTVTPRIQNNSGQVVELKPITLTISVENRDPDVKVSQSRVTLNRLDTRESAWQIITFEPTLADTDMSYDVAVKDAKGKLLEGYELCPEGTYVDNEGCLTLGIGDSEIADGKYKVIVTPTVCRKDGTTKKLKEKTVEVTVSTPKVKAAFQNAKMTIDVADTGVTEKSNAIVFTGTNAELIKKVDWNVSLSKKPKGAGDDEIRYDAESDGKEFTVSWANGEPEDERWLNVTPGTYEFTLTPERIEAVEGLQIEASAPIKLSVTVKKTLPAMKLSKTSVKLNAKFGQTEYIYGTLNREDWEIRYAEAVMTSYPKGAEKLKSNVTVQYDNGRLAVRADEKAAEGKYTFAVTPEIYKNGVVTTLAAQKITVEIKNEIPVAKLASTRLTLNTLYAEKYNNIDDDMNRKTAISLNKNYGESSYEVNDFKVTFTGKASQQADAAKIRWELGEDGTVAVALDDATIALGDYKFDITPVIRSDETGAKLTLKKVSVTVKVEKKEIKATAKTSGKIDLIDRKSSGIIYTVDLSDKKLDRIKNIELEGTVNGVNCNSLFESVGLEKNDSSAKITVKAKTPAELSTKITYSMQLVVTTEKGKICYVPIKIKPTQSAIKLTMNTKAITLYKQAADTYAPEIKASAVSGAKPPKDLTITDVSVGNEDFRAILSEDGTTIKFKFTDDTAKAKYKANTTVKLPVYIQVDDQASDVIVKADITVTIKN